MEVVPTPGEKPQILWADCQTFHLGPPLGPTRAVQGFFPAGPARLLISTSADDLGQTRHWLKGCTPWTQAYPNGRGAPVPQNLVAIKV